MYVAGSIEDQSFPDEQKVLLEKSLDEAGVVHTIETYQAHHGFAVPDNPSFDSDAAERHWAAMERFFGSALTRAAADRSSLSPNRSGGACPIGAPVYRRISSFV